jgi:hypothetical protein
MPASLNAPCADETDGHAAHDAHEVLACQVAERIRRQRRPTNENGAPERPASSHRETITWRT